MKLHSKVGFKKDGTLVAKDLKISLDGGAYNAMGPTATFLCGNFGAMLYRYPELPLSRASTSTPTSRRPAPCAASAPPSRSMPPRSR